MNGFIRRLRGILGTGLTWAVGWAVVFGGLMAFLGRPVTIIAGFGLGMGLVGFFGGSLFAAILSITERRQRLEDLSLRRVALWGAISCLVLAGAFSLIGGGGFVWDFLATMTLLGAGCSSGTVAVARRVRRRELIEAGEEALAALGGE